MVINLKSEKRQGATGCEMTEENSDDSCAKTKL